MRHTMKSYLPITAITLIATGWLSACSDKDDDIPLSEVPINVITTIQDILPGIVLHEAEREAEGSVVIYQLEGTLINGKEYEIKITGSGEIIKIERED